MRRIISLIIMTFFGVALAFGQTTTGRLSGVVSGPDGVLPNATIVAKDTNTNKETTVISKDDGSFLFPQIEFGTYTVTVTSSGFKTFIANALKVDVGREYTLNPTLEVGNVQENVTITAGADVVTANTAQVTNTVSPQQILSLPLVARNPLTLTNLQAGTAANTFQGTSINGMRTTFTNITRDGINIQDNFIRTNATDFAPGRPTVDDTGEFTITTSNQEADQGYGGAQVRLVTPRGTKDFHGALFAYNRNSHFGANNFFNNRAGVARPFRNRNQYGGKVSGPFPTLNFGEGDGSLFQTGKGFFFFAYEGVRDPVSAIANRTILTPTARGGGFSFNRAANGSPTAICPSGTAGSLCTVSNLLTFAQSQGLAVPSTIDPYIQSQVISALPTASNTTGGDGLNTAGFTLNRANDTQNSTYTTRIDVDATAKDSFNGVFSYAKQQTLRPDADTTGFSKVPGVNQFSINKTFSLAYRRVISANFFNEFRGGFFNSNVPFIRTDPVPNFFLANAGNLVANLLQSGAFSGGSVSYPVNTFLDQGRTTGYFTVQDNADLIVGKHSFRFGGQIQKFKINSYNFAGVVPTYVVAAGGGTPSLSATNFASAGGISNAQLTTANNLLALFGGLYNTATQTFNVLNQTSGFQAGPNYQPFRYADNALYVSDRWNAGHGLTLSLGVRYDVYPALKLANGLGLEPVVTDVNNPTAAAFNPGGTYNFIGGNAGVKNAFYKTDYNNFAPSIGVAYSPNFESGIGKFLFGKEGKTVLRGGYSQAYGNDSTVTSISNAAAGNAGLAATANNLVTLNGTLTSPVAIGAPAFITPPRTYLQNNTLGSNFGTVFLINPKLQTPRIDQYSFGIQREFAGNMALEVRYVGSRSKNLIRGVDLNQIDIFNNGFLADFNRALNNLNLPGASSAFCNPATVSGCQALTIFQSGAGSAGHLGVGTGGLAAATFNNSVLNGTPADLALSFIGTAANLNNQPNSTTPNATPFVKFLANPATGAIDYVINDASYSYNSLQVELRRRFTNGLYFQANYTFSKNLTNAIGTGQTLFEPYLDNNNKGLENMRADFDLTHVFNFNGIYQLPFGKGKMFLDNGGVIDKIFGGWELSGISQITSGAPISFVDTRGTLNRTGRSGRQTARTTLTNQQVANLAGTFYQNGNVYFVNPSVINSTGRASEGFGTTPFSGQVFFNVNPGQTGNLGRNVIDGPKFFNINAALLKSIRFGETMRVQLRAEAFNVLNNVNFSFLTAAEQRQSITSANFGKATTATTPRQLQFAVRFEF